MSLGYVGVCKKEVEDDQLVIYSYAGDNWNDCKKNKSENSMLYDGRFIIYKDCFKEPEIHTKLKKMPSGRKKIIEKRITHMPKLTEYIANKKIVIDRECKNAVKIRTSSSIDYIAFCLILKIFKRYQLEGALPEKESFIQ